MRDVHNCLALRNLNQFSSFNTVFRHFDYQKSILVQNKHDIQNQHEKLYRIAYILTKYFFRQNLTRRGPQGEIQKKWLRGSTGRILVEKIFS